MKKEVFNKKLEEALNYFLQYDFEGIKKEKLMEIVNELYGYYRQIVEDQCDERDKRRFRNNMVLGLNETETKNEEDRLKRDNITCLMKDEEEVISYVYGAYIANRIAHQFKTNTRRRKMDLNQGNRIAKKSYALKSLFTKYIIDGLKETSRYEFGWGKDEKTGHIALSINITPYSNKKLYEYHKRTDRNVDNIYISIHIIDPELTNAIRDLPENILIKGNKPTEILNQADDIRKLYKDLEREER